MTKEKLTINLTEMCRKNHAHLSKIVTNVKKAKEEAKLISVKDIINPKLKTGKLIYLENDEDKITVELTNNMLEKFEDSLLRNDDKS